ncbi:MAG: zinc-dependent metalloprotease [bacterium]|nr:zinc-dependent metalloprotease [bacterium]
MKIRTKLTSVLCLLLIVFVLAPLLSSAHLLSDRDSDVTLRGKLEVLHHDDFTNPENITFEYFLKTSSNEKYQLYPKNGLRLVSGSEIEITGEQVEDRIFGEIKVVTNETEKGLNQTQLQAAPTPYKLGVFLVNPSGSTIPFSKTEAGERVFNGQIQSFVKENSYNRKYLSGDVHGWIESASNTCMTSVDFSNTDVLNYITQNNIDLSQYKHILFVVNCTLYHHGFSTIGPTTVTVNGNEYTFSISDVYITEGTLLPFSGSIQFLNAWLQPFSWSNFDYFVMHELGHGFGVYHANGLDCYGESLGSYCFPTEYGNLYDTMGAGHGYSLHFNGINKQILGWIKHSEVLNINASGTYTINSLERLGGYKFAKISNPNKPNSSIVYQVENRRSYGFDSALETYPELSQNQYGLFVNRYNGMNTQLIDTTASASGWVEDIQDAALTGLNIFSDIEEGISIGPIVNVTKSSITFNVTVSP